jgi:hypothetical protein
MMIGRVLERLQNSSKLPLCVLVANALPSIEEYHAAAPEVHFRVSLMFTFHPAAATRFNQRAKDLVWLLKQKKASPPLPESAQNPTNIPYVVTLTEDDIRDEQMLYVVDPWGSIIERTFPFQGAQVGLQEQDHGRLSSLARDIFRSPGVSEMASLRLIENTIFEWVRNDFLGSSSLEFTEYLLGNMNAEKIYSHVFVPIANTIVLKGFSFCGIEVVNLSSDIFDSWLDSALSTGQDKQDVKNVVDKFRVQYQGRGAFRVPVRCEARRGVEMAHEAVEKVSSLLSIFKGFAFCLRIKSVMLPSGCEHLRTFVALLTDEENMWSFSHENLDRSSSESIVIDEDWLIRAREMGLDTLSKIYTKSEPSDFEESILNMSYLYSRSCFTSNTLEKIVYALSALESMLLKDNSEPIQQNIGERMAIFSRTELDERKRVIQNLKQAYGLRSRYIHHGTISKDEDVAGEFLMNMWIFYVSLLDNSGRFKTRLEFISAIEDRKLS